MRPLVDASKAPRSDDRPPWTSPARGNSHQPPRLGLTVWGGGRPSRPRPPSPGSESARCVSVGSKPFLRPRGLESVLSPPKRPWSPGGRLRSFPAFLSRWSRLKSPERSAPKALAAPHPSWRFACETERLGQLGPASRCSFLREGTLEQRSGVRSGGRAIPHEAEDPRQAIRAPSTARRPPRPLAAALPLHWKGRRKRNGYTHMRM